MGKSIFMNAQIIGMLHQVASGLTLDDVCRKKANQQYDVLKMRSKYAAWIPSMIADMKVMEDENRIRNRYKSKSHLHQSDLS